MGAREDSQHERQRERETAAESADAAAVLAAQELTNIAVTLERIGGVIVHALRRIADAQERIAQSEETRARAAAEIAALLTHRATRRRIPN